MKQQLEETFRKISDLKVLVVGETIIDEFVNVSYEGQSMKSFCPVFKLEEGKVVQQGGAQAIANHLYDFAGEVKVITNTGGEIIKTRYVDIGDKKKHVELNRFDTHGFKTISVDTREYDIVIVADFGHGFCDKLEINDGFHLMCQTNSNNFGFNRISKWKAKKKKSACIDLREASLQLNRRIEGFSDVDMLGLYNYELNTQHLYVTTGSKGAKLTNGQKVISHPSFRTEIVDTIGAGDTFFAFSAVMSHLGYHENMLYLPSLAASLSTTWLCNEKAVTKKTLLEHAAKYV